MGSHYGIILRLQDNITELDYGIILRNDIMELYYGIICMKRIPGDAWDAPESLGPRGRPWDRQARPWDPWGSPWDARARPWDPRGRPWDAPGTPLGPLGTPRDTYGTPYGSQKWSYLDKYTAPEALDCRVRSCPSGPIA